MSKGTHFVTLQRVHYKNGNTSKPTQNGRYFSNDILKLNETVNEDCCILNPPSSLTYPTGPVHNMLSSAQIMAWPPDRCVCYMDQ